MAGGETDPSYGGLREWGEGKGDQDSGLHVDDNHTGLADQNNNFHSTDKESSDNNFTNHGNDFNDNSYTSNCRSLRTRTRTRNRKLFPEKVHHKRQTLQDMARPLKQWLYRNKENPYPSKSQKLSLAAGSHMTLVQVSNWFANARRRLKNVVKEPNITWARRVKLYNENVVGNAELFSISSDDTVWDWDDNSEVQNNTFPIDQAVMISVVNSAANQDLVPSRTNTPTPENGSDGLLSHVPDSLKYKQTILQRYLSDAYQRTVDVDEGILTNKRDRRQSGSLGSRDYEEMSTSSASSRINYRVHDDFGEELEFLAGKKRKTTEEMDQQEEDMRQKEMDAIFALTSLANSRTRP
ncbi:hypothetical protein SNE40_022220 [Patella caerulea]|uniref:Homeobox domain-containing protein n=1 Tax=Patella caerulea TaxID=87958 RepID=A0AAN8G059_PATCE